MTFFMLKGEWIFIKSVIHLKFFLINFLNVYLFTKNSRIFTKLGSELYNKIKQLTTIGTTKNANVMLVYDDNSETIIANKDIINPHKIPTFNKDCFFYILSKLLI